MKKKFLSTLLAICMIISLTPAAFATDAIVTEGSNESLLDNGATTNDIGIKLESVDSAKVAKVGDTEYDTLQAAIDAIETSGEVDILTDIVLTDAVTIAASQTVTLDLNGKTITYNSTTQGEAMITNKGTLTINDSSDPDTGVINYNYTGAADSSYGKGNYTISNAGTLTVNGGKITIANLRAHAKYPIDNNSTSGNAIWSSTAVTCITTTQVPSVSSATAPQMRIA